MGKNKSNYDFNSGNLLFFIFRNFKILITISIIASILSAIISMTITDKYKSTVVMFPVSSASVSKSLLSINYTSSKGSLMSFGEVEEAEQLMQILNSDEIRSRIIKKFNLMKHYKIDSTSRFPYTKLYEEFKSNFSFRQTEYMSVIIEVLDPKPDTAALMANETAALIDTIMNKMQKDRAFKAFALVKTEYQNRVNEISTLEDTLNYIRSKGVIEYEKQSEVFSKGYADALISRNQSAADELNKRLSLLAKFGGKYLSIVDFLKFEKEQLAFLTSKYAEAKLETEQNLPHKFIVDSAKKAEKKDYPHRLIIVILSTISTFFLTLIVLITIDNIKKFK
jgi:Chain length determinant protein